MHLHLAAVHVPIVLSPLALVLFAAALVKRRRTRAAGGELESLAHLIVLFAALTAGVSFFSGAPAFETAQSELADKRDLVELHAVVGRGAFFLLALLAAGSLRIVGPRFGLSGRRSAPPAEADAPPRPSSSDRLSWLMVAGLGAACGLLVWTGYLGGSIRHF